MDNPGRTNALAFLVVIMVLIGGCRLCLESLGVDPSAFASAQGAYVALLAFPTTLVHAWTAGWQWISQNVFIVVGVCATPFVLCGLFFITVFFRPSSGRKSE